MTATERAQDYAPMGEVAEHLYDALNAFYKAGGKPTVRQDKGEWTMESDFIMVSYFMGTPIVIIIGGMFYDAMKQYRKAQRQQSRVNHPTSKGLPRK